MIYHDILNKFCSFLNFNTDFFSKNYSVQENFVKINNQSVELFFNEPITEQNITLLFKKEVEFIVNGFVLKILEEDLKFRTLLIKVNNELIELSDFSLSKNNLVIPNIDYNTIEKLYFVDKSLYSGNYTLINNIATNNKKNLVNLGVKHSVYKVLGSPSIFFIESENKLESMLTKMNNSIYILPVNSVASKHQTANTIADQETNIGNEYYISRVHNFTLLLKINKVKLNNVNNRIDNSNMLYILDTLIPVIIRTIGGIKSKNMESAVSFKNEGLVDGTDAYLLYGVNFEFITNICSMDLKEDIEIDIINFTQKQGVNIDGN